MNYFEIIEIGCFDNFFKDKLIDLNINNFYLYQKINKKEDFSNNLFLDKKNDVKILLLDNINLVSIAPKDSIIFFKANNSEDLFLAIKNKRINAILDPISADLIFDEASANLLKENNKSIIFNYNEYRKNTYKSIKQSQFIIDLLLKKQIPFFFTGFAKSHNDICQSIILENFLKNFNLNSEFIKKQMQKETFEKTCLKRK
jgi:hypothetical protein